MCITEYNEEETRRLFFEDGFRIGFKRSFEESTKRGKVLLLFDLVKEGVITPEIAAKHLDLSLEEFDMVYDPDIDWNHEFEMYRKNSIS